MSPERERELEAAAEVGRAQARRLCEDMRRQEEQTDWILNYLRNTEAATRILNAQGGATTFDVQLMVFRAGNTSLEPPRPRLVEA